ncbi:hypothetical protein BDF14DRAFT_1741228 [Spinellus fusiger]|nr:hypothetical protein BDF14DRAFT_1741228 [Spinellus fusiger]
MAGQDSDTMLDSCSAHSQGTDLFTHSTDTLAIEQVTAEESPLLIPKQESEWTVVGEKSSKRKAFHAKEEIGHCRLEKELSNVSTPDSTQQNGKYDKEEPICLQSQHQQQQQQSFKKDNAVDTEEALVQVSPVLSPHQQTSHMSIEEEEIALAMEHDSGHRPTTQSNKDSLKVQLDRIEEVKPELDELQQTKARQDIIRTLPLDKKLLVGRRESPTVITQNDSKAEQSDSESTFDDEATDSTWLSLLTPDESLSLVGDEERTEKTLSLLPISDPSLPSSLYNHSKTIHVDTSRLSQRQVPHDKPEQRWYSPFSTGFNLAQLCDDTSKPWDALKTPFVRGSFSESSNFLDVRSKNYTWNKLSHGVHFARKTALDPVFYKKHFSSPGALSHLHHETHLPLPVFSLQSSDKMNSMSLFSQSSSTCMPQRLNKTSEEIGDRKECV